MISGMTGFGAANFAFGKIKGMVEIKTVNHRYLDIAYYLPSGFSVYEERIAKSIASQLKRGRVTVSVKITDKPQLNINLSEEAVSRYVNFGKKLSKKFHLPSGLTVAEVMRLPGVIESKEYFVEGAALWPAASVALQKALKSVVAMRRREGASLKADIHIQLTRMTASIGQIKSRAQAILKDKKGRMTQEEFAGYQKSNDINEELSRLAHHISEAKQLLAPSQEAGKKLDFIAQEMQRETNTVGSKVQDKEISAMVIAIKSKIEKIREQANNVE